MARGLCFWILMLLWAVGFGYTTYAIGWNHYGLGNVMLFLLIGLLGWQVYGPALKG